MDKKRDIIMYHPYTFRPVKEGDNIFFTCIMCKKKTLDNDDGCCFHCSAKRSAEENYGGLIGYAGSDGPSYTEIILMEKLKGK